MKKIFNIYNLLSLIGWILIALIVYWFFSLGGNEDNSIEHQLMSKYDDIEEGKNKSYYNGFSDGLEYVKEHFIRFCEENNLGFDYKYEGIIEGYIDGYKDADEGEKPRYKIY